MNFLTLGAKSIKKAEAAKRQCLLRNDEARAMGITMDLPDPDDVYNSVLDAEYVFLQKSMEQGLRYFKMAQDSFKNIKSEDEGRNYMLTVRPREGCKFTTLKNSVDEFINKWSGDWKWCEWVYEQKGETIEDAGKGLHVHIVFCTTKCNYHKSHILRDAKRIFTYVESQCIQVDNIKFIDSARWYIRGDKGEKKEAAVLIDNIWRQNTGVEVLYTRGQVQPLVTKTPQLG